ncbi:transcription factor IIIC subunit delta N-term-domain-containing protein [Lyophyllum atratum]|nr:transcription factor IIIC subunit delta N-term-domain-containing protein [Lyophyllum atratum]
MSCFPIYAKLSFTESPSTTCCLQWSDDGQTPNYAAVLKVPKSQSISHDKGPDWFRTIIDFDKKRIQNWPDISQDWSAVAFGSLDVGLQAVALSPSNLTDDGGCLAAVLTSNMDLSLWAPEKNRVQGKWTKIQEVTPLVSRSALGDRSTAQAQVTSVTWSRQADFDIDPAPGLDTSLLVAGTRGGMVMFLRFEDGAVRYLDEIKVADNWITQLAFSPWTLVEKGKCEARIACGTSDGVINLLTLTQSLTSVPSTTGFGPAFNVKRGIQVCIQQVFESDKRCLTALTWILCKGTSILIVCKPGLVSFIAPPSSNLGWSGRRTLSLQAQRISVGSSPLQPVSGVHHVPTDDVLLVCLSDGSIHAVHHVSSEPSWTADIPRDDMTSQRLSQNARLAFEQTQPENTKYTDVNRIYGLIPFNSQGALLWLQESCHPTDLDYTYDAKQHIVLVAAQLWQCNESESILREFSDTLNAAKTIDGAPIHLLGPFLSYLLDHREIFPDILRVLQCPITSMDFCFENISSPPDPSIGPTLQAGFRKCISRYLFGSNQLLRLRMKLSVADMMLRSPPVCPAQVECEQIACQLFDVISQIVLRILIHHLAPIATVLTLSDAPFALRLTDQASSPGCPPGLVAEARCLADIIHSTLSTAEPMRTVPGNPMSEVCPACDAVILLESGAHAICANGHSWGRCSITSFILSTGMVRRCTGCSRKALLPLSCKDSSSVTNWLPEQAQCWLVEELLEAASRCLFCGNIFVSSL